MMGPCQEPERPTCMGTTTASCGRTAGGPRRTPRAISCRGCRTLTGCSTWVAAPGPSPSTWPPGFPTARWSASTRPARCWKTPGRRQAARADPTYGSTPGTCITWPSTTPRSTSCTPTRCCSTWATRLRRLRRCAGCAARAAWSRRGTATTAGCSAPPGDRSWWGSLWAERLTESPFGDRAVEHGLATREDLERLADAWLRWAASDDGWFLIPHGEVLCRVPGGGLLGCVSQHCAEAATLPQPHPRWHRRRRWPDRRRPSCAWHTGPGR